MVLDATNNKRTDPEGDVDKQSDTQAHLSDFDIDGAEVGVDGARLKPKHIAFLQSLIDIIKGAPGQRFTIAIGGFADTLNRSGSFDNQDLSERRARAVESFFRANLPPGALVSIDLKGFGPVRESLPNTPDRFARAVDVALVAPGDPRPRRPSPGGRANPGSFPRPDGRGGFVFGCSREFEIPRSQNFRIRIENLDFVLKVASMRLQIVDDTARLGAEYGFTGVDVIVLESPETTFIRAKTSYKTFSTTVPCRVTDFQGAVLQTGFGASLANPLGPLPRPKITLTFKDKDGVEQQAVSEIDMDGKEGTRSRSITGSLSLSSTCRGSRGALEIDRTNIFR